MKKVVFTILFLTLSSYAEVIDYIVATVQNEPILHSDVLEALKGKDASINNTKKLYNETLQELIDDVLIEKECRKLNLLVTDDEINSSIKSVQQQNRLDEISFKRALLSQGLTFEQYKSQLQKHLYRMKLIQAKIRNRVQVSAQDVKQAQIEQMKLHKKDFRIKARYILFELGKNPSKQLLQKQSALAKEAIKAINQGTSFDSVVSQLISQHKNVKEGDLGIVSRGELMPEFDAIAFSIQPNHAAGPIRSIGGLHVIMVEEYLPLQQIPLEKVEKELHKQLYEKELERALKQYVRELREASYVEING